MMRLNALVLAGLAAGCAATPIPSVDQPPEREDGAWGRDGSLVSGSVDAQSQTGARRSSDMEAALASMPAARDWRGAGSDAGTAAPPTKDTEGATAGDTDRENRFFSWIHDDGSAAREERRIGPNEQPEWTTERRFTTTQVYVLAPGQIELEQWMRTVAPRHQAPQHSWQTEASFGMCGGFEVDVSENAARNADSGVTNHVGFQGELKYALAKWGVIPLNPTLVAGYIQNHRAPDALEGRVLLATDFGGGGWHSAANFGMTQDTEITHQRQSEASAGFSRTIGDSRWSVGGEIRYDSTTVRGHRSEDEHHCVAGPSVQWRPTENTHLDVAALFGVSGNDRRDPRVEVQIVFGIDFGPPREKPRTADVTPDK